jgi:hypothetical protein
MAPMSSCRCYTLSWWYNFWRQQVVTNIFELRCIELMQMDFLKRNIVSAREEKNPSLILLSLSFRNYIMGRSIFRFEVFFWFCIPLPDNSFLFSRLYSLLSSYHVHRQERHLFKDSFSSKEERSKK